MGGPGVMKASLQKVKCQTRVHGYFGLVFFFFFFFACVHHVGLAYISSDLRTCTQRMFARNISAKLMQKNSFLGYIFETLLVIL